MHLTRSELERYDRQIRIPGWGLKGQKRLKRAKVAVVGVGGLGCASSLYLTAAGIGRIVLVDMGKFELSNLNRQILGCQPDLGRDKVIAAREKLKMLNPETEVEAIVAEITEDNVSHILRDVDVVVDGMDNWRTRFILNRFCVLKNIPLIHAAVSEMYGQLITVLPGKGPCLRCVLPKNPQEIAPIPVLGAVPAMLASLQVVETIKLITGIGKPMVGSILFIDLRRMLFETIQVSRREDCPVCGSERL